jgi:hypothetical protein
MNNRLVKRLRMNSSGIFMEQKMNDNSAAQSNSNLGNLKMFEFMRVRIAKKKDFMKMVSASDLFDPNVLTGVPKKRSGHRAVCNDENLWIWGGYCPVEEISDTENNEDDTDNQGEPSPVFAEVKSHISKMFYSIEKKLILTSKCSFGNSIFAPEDGHC